MPAPLFVRPQAESDLADAYAYYEACRRGLGNDFLESVGQTLDRIVEAPLSYPQVYRGVRRAPLRRFPFCVYYVISASAVVVIAVLHAMRDPATWKGRR